MLLLFQRIFSTNIQINLFLVDLRVPRVHRSDPFCNIQDSFRRAISNSRIKRSNRIFCYSNNYVHVLYEWCLEGRDRCFRSKIFRTWAHSQKKEEHSLLIWLIKVHSLRSTIFKPISTKEANVELTFFKRKRWISIT